MNASPDNTPPTENDHVSRSREHVRNGTLFDALLSTVQERMSVPTVSDRTPAPNLDVLFAAVDASLDRLPVGFSEDERVVRHLNALEYNTVLVADAGGEVTQTLLAGLSRIGAETRIIVFGDYLGLYSKWSHHVTGYVDSDEVDTLSILRDYLLQVDYGLVTDPQHLTLVVNRVDLWEETVEGEHLRAVAEHPFVSVIATVAREESLEAAADMLGGAEEGMNFVLGTEAVPALVTPQMSVPMLPLPVLEPRWVPVPGAEFFDRSFLPDALFGGMMVSLEEAGVGSDILAALASTSPSEALLSVDTEEQYVRNLLHVTDDDDELYAILDYFMDGTLADTLDAMYSRYFVTEELDFSVVLPEPEPETEPKTVGSVLTDEEVDAVIAAAIAEGVWADVTEWDSEAVDVAAEVFSDSESLPVSKVDDSDHGEVPAPPVDSAPTAVTESTPSKETATEPAAASSPEPAEGGSETSGDGSEIPENLEGKYNTLLAIGKSDAEARTILGLNG